MKAARIYIRVSTAEQDLERQHKLIEDAKAKGYYIAGTYEDKASGTKSDRPGLQRMIDELQPGDVVIAEKIDRISRAPLKEAEALVNAIKDKGAKLSIPGMVDLSDIEAEGMAKIVLDAMQDMLLKIAMQMARDDYETRRERQMQGIALAKKKGVYKGRPRDEEKRKQIAGLLGKGAGIREVARAMKCSPSTVQKIKNEMAKSGSGNK
ncbi:recombinase family protein [Modicisalibacter sp. 'Wilcox']|uniref:recombinase family protein n=1 Tax=Modicisalibacter sp. 'Wilcox' TaxID=2679914 RepID=UPI0013D16559|nr:recombinase family protein [Modicisalibacter sp. 'Wilcox']